MTKKHILTIVTMILAAALMLSACGNKSDNNNSINADAENSGTVIADTKVDVENAVKDFYKDLPSADPVSMSTYTDGMLNTVFTKDGDKMCMEDENSGITYYMFTENGKKYFMSDGDTASEDEDMYDSWADTIENSLTMYVTGIFNTDDDDDPFNYAAEKSETSDGEQLIYMITGEENSNAIKLTITGIKTSDGKVTSIVYVGESPDGEYSVEFRFVYDNISVTIPEYTIES